MKRTLICLAFMICGCVTHKAVEQSHAHKWTLNYIEDAGQFLIFNYKCIECKVTYRTYKPE